MESLTTLLIAIAAVVAPLLLAWWLLARGVSPRTRLRRRPGQPGRTLPPRRDTMEP